MYLTSLCLFLLNIGVVATLLAQQDYTPSESGLNKAFEAAYEQSSCDTVKALLDYAESRGALLEQGSTQFHSVVPSTRRARRVLAGGLSIQKDADKALRYAVRGNDIEMVRLLMDYEADIHAFNEEAVLVAAQKGHVEILKLLIQAGADIETKAGAPLRQASEGGHVEAVRVLCESGADTMWGGCSALRNAASQGTDEGLSRVSKISFCTSLVFSGFIHFITNMLISIALYTNRL